MMERIADDWGACKRAMSVAKDVAMSANDDERMQRVVAAAATGAIRSPYGRWLAANHDAFADMLKRYRPRWEILAETLAAEKLLPVPDEFWSDDPEVREPARKRAGRLAKRGWDRVHARLKDRAPPPSPERLSEPRASDGGRGAVSALLAQSARPDADDDDFIKPVGGPKVWTTPKKD